MKNLKRLLCLALTGVMLSGMMVMGASAADFTDADEIVNTEAVDTMVALNIISGKPDGSFDPEGLVTRAEMAKMIAVAVNGGVAPEFGTKTAPTYTDIKGHWAEQFIEYCSDMKYINGRGNGTFDPEGKVTGTEAAKMVLTALGYESRAYQLTGADWAINTNALAGRDTKPALYEDLQGTNMNAPITRDVAARIIWNGVQNYIVEYNPNVTITGTDITYGYQKSKTTTLLKQAYDANIWVGTFLGNDKMDESISKGEIEVYGKLDTADADDPDIYAYLPSDYDISNIGEETKVIFKDGKGGTKNQPDKNDTIYGVFNTGATGVVHGATNTSSIANGDDAKGKVKVEGTVYEVAPEGSILYNYDTDNFDHWTDAAMGAQMIEKLRNQKNGDTIKLVTDPSTNKVAYAFVVNTKIAVVTSISATRVTLSNSVGTLVIDDNDVAEDLEKDDVVTVTTLYKGRATADGAYNIVKKAETVQGEVTAFKDNVSVTIDGEAHKIVGEVAMNTYDIDDAITTFNNADENLIGDEFLLYKVNGFVWAAVPVSEKASNYSVVLETKNTSTGSKFDTLQLYVMNAEGDKTVITVSADSYGKKAGEGDNNKIVDAADYPVGSVITYSINKDDEAVVKMEKAWATGTTGFSYNKDTKTIGNKATAANCVLFVNTAKAGDAAITNSQVKIPKLAMKAYDIRSLGSIKSSDPVNDAAYGKNYTLVYNADGTKVVAAVLDLNGTPNGATSNRVYGIVSKYDGTTKVDGTQYRWYTVDSNDEQYTVYMTKKNYEDSTTKLGVGKLVSFEPTSDNIYVKSQSITDNDVTNLDTNSGVIDVIDSGAAYANEYNTKDETVSLWTGIKAWANQGATVPATNPDNLLFYREDKTTAQTYAVNKDTKFYYVDKDKNVGVESGNVSKFSEADGFNNIVVMYENISGTDFARAVIVEVSGESNISGAATTVKPTLCVGNTDKSSGTIWAGTDADDVEVIDANLTLAADTNTGLVNFTTTSTGSTSRTVTVNGETYNGGNFRVGRGTTPFTVVVTVNELFKNSTSYTFTVTVTAE